MSIIGGKLVINNGKNERCVEFFIRDYVPYVTFSGSVGVITLVGGRMIIGNRGSTTITVNSITIYMASTFLDVSIAHQGGR